MLNIYIDNNFRKMFINHYLAFFGRYPNLLGRAQYVSFHTPLLTTISITSFDTFHRFRQYTKLKYNFLFE